MGLSSLMDLNEIWMAHFNLLLPTPLSPIPFLPLHLSPSLAVSPLPPPRLHPSLSSSFSLHSVGIQTHQRCLGLFPETGNEWRCCESMCVWRDCYFCGCVNHFHSVSCVCVCYTMQRGQRCVFSLSVWDWYNRRLWRRSMCLIASGMTAVTRMCTHAHTHGHCH